MMGFYNELINPVFTQAALEVEHSFPEKNNYFIGYLLRTVFELTVSIGLLVMTTIFLGNNYKDGVENFFNNKRTIIKPIICTIEDQDYKCVGHNRDFYHCILIGGEWKM